MSRLLAPLLCLGLALPAAIPPAAHAAFDPAVVADDARWVVYADFANLRDSIVGRELINSIQAAQTSRTQGVIGLNFPKILETVGTITAYGANFTPDAALADGTLVVQGTADLRKIAESLLLQANLASPADVSEITDLPFPVYSLNDSPRPPADGTTPAPETTPPAAPRVGVYVAFPPEPVIILSRSRPQLLKARDIVRGAAPSLRATPSSPLTPLLAPAADSLLFAASVTPTEAITAAQGPHARILQLAHAGSLALGERGADTFAHVELHANSAATADKLLKIVEGMTAMLSLAESNDEQLTEFLNSARVAKSDRTVTLDLGYSSARLVQMTRSLRATGRTTPPGPAVAPTTVGEWTAPAGAAPGTLWHSLDQVALVNGATLSLVARQGRDAAGFDLVEITPAGAAGGMPLVFRAEHMRLTGFRPVTTTGDSGPRHVIARGEISEARFVFPGADGTYTVRVAYRPDPAGQATFAVRVQPPAPAPAAQP